jgi:hypothetical protein
MTTPSFPILPGQSWSVHKKPTFSTLVASHASGREVRDALYQNPIWQFELTFDGLDSSDGAYPGLGGQSLQSLMGLFLQCQGQWGAFLYGDPTDYSVCAQGFGTGDGTKTAFQLTRSLGGFSESLVAPFAPAAPALNPVSTTLYAPNNLVLYSQDAAQSAWTNTHVTVTSGIADPFGGTTAQTLTASAGSASISQGSDANGANYVNSVWLRRRAGSGAISLTTPGNTPTTVALTSSWRLFSLAGSPSAGSATFAIGIATGADAIDVCDCHLEVSSLSTPGTYFQTAASAYFGAPWITAAGALVDPSAYAIANGIVTFAGAPSPGAALQWTGMFSFLCRFDDDAEDFEQFMQDLWAAKSIKLRSVRGS